MRLHVYASTFLGLYRHTRKTGYSRRYTGRRRGADRRHCPCRRAVIAGSSFCQHTFEYRNVARGGIHSEPPSLICMWRVARARRRRRRRRLRWQRRKAAAAAAAETNARSKSRICPKHITHINRARQHSSMPAAERTRARRPTAARARTAMPRGRHGVARPPHGLVPPGTSRGCARRIERVARGSALR